MASNASNSVASVSRVVYNGASEPMMAKIGRNDPCPCGSGQKYKRCCLPREEAAAAERAATQARQVEPPVMPFEMLSDDDGLDQASNVVIDLIDAGRLDE